MLKEGELIETTIKKWELLKTIRNINIESPFTQKILAQALNITVFHASFVELMKLLLAADILRVKNIYGRTKTYEFNKKDKIYKKIMQKTSIYESVAEVIREENLLHEDI